MVSKLDLYILNNDSSVAPFPSEAEQIVLYDFTFEAQRMGSAPEITATIQATGSLENSLTTKVFCEYKGERYFLKNTPSSSKDNTDPRYTFDLTFVSERTILDNVYMIDAVQGNSGLDGYQSNSTTIVFMGDIYEAVARLNAAMSYTGVGYSVVIDSGIYTEDKQVSFNDKYFTEVLQEYAQIFSVPYYFVGKVAHFGWAQYDVPTVKYLDGLISVSKDIQNTRIINRATATGSSDNLPHYYPNPTPRGFITYSVPNGITVNSEHKLALLPVGSSLIYIPETQEIAVKGTYGFSKITDRHPDFSVSDQYATLIIPQYDSSEGQIVSGPVALLKNTFPESKDFTIDLVVRHPKGALTLSLDNDFPVDPLGAVACTRVDDALIEDTSITVTIASSNTVTSPTHNNDEETTFRLNISDFPAGTERYIYMRFLNRGINRSGSKIFQFSFSVSERGLIQGWHIQDSNGITDEKVVNAADYGLRVSDNFAGGTVSYSVTRKIPYATTLMPPIYRESSGEHRFYNAINGAYKGITFENEYSAESPKEGITKFEDIKPTIKGITNASGYRIDMFSAFAYDLNDNDDTVLSDGNTEEYQHPYFYAKLRKIDGAYGFNLFDQALESGEMAVSMTSGVCGACKFTIMVDKNTQRNLVMVDDDGNLMYDASGNVMMATDARGLDKQNDTVNNEVWVALKKDNSTFGQIMPNVEYNHYPETSDTFVLLHILMPEVYIKAAEERLKTAIIDFLVANNSEQFNSGINFSRIYLHNNPDVAAILTENSRISIDYNDKLYSYFISSVTYRKAKEDILPEISVELTQDIQPTTSNIQAAINAITVTQQQVAVIAGKSEKQPKYLKSDTADTAQGKITFEKGLDFTGNLNTKNFKRGALDGRGFGVYLDSQGRIVVEADKIISRQGGYGGGGSDIGNYVTTDTIQDILAVKDFDKGLMIGGISVSKLEGKDIIYLDGNLVVRGGITMYGDNGQTTPSIWDAFPYDDRTIKRNAAGEFYAVGGGGSSTGNAATATSAQYLYQSNIQESINYPRGADHAIKVVNCTTTQLDGFFSDYATVLSVASPLSNFQIGMYADPFATWASHPRFRAMRNTDGTWTDWKELAFVDDLNAYLSLAGGTITGAGANPLTINRTTLDSVGLLLRSNNIIKGEFGWAPASGTYIYNAPSGGTLGIKDDGTPYFNGNTLLHSGNYSDYALPKDGTAVAANRLIEEVVTDLNNATAGRIFTMTSGYGSTAGNKPTEYWVTGLTLAYAQNSSFRRQLAFADAIDESLYLRAEHIGGWGEWSKILTSSNFYDYALPITGGTVSGDVTANIYYANKGFVLSNVGDEYSGLVAGPHISTVGNAKDIWLYNSSADIKVYTPTIFSVQGGNVAIGGTTATEKLHLYGNMLFEGEAALKSSLIGEVLYMSGSYLVIGGGSLAKGIPTYIDGQTVYVRAGNYVATFSDAGGLTWNGNLEIAGALRLGQNNRTRIIENPFAAYGMTLADSNNNPLIMVSYYNDHAYVFNYKNSNENSGIVFYDDGRVAVEVAENFRIKSKGAALSGIDIGASDTDIWQISHRGSFSNNELHFYHNANGTWSNSVLSLSVNGDVATGGNLLIKGALTMNYSSDERLKKNIRKVNASEVLMSLGGVWQYEYIDSEVQKNSVYDGTHFGLIYQNVKGTSLDIMCHEREDSFGTLNYLDANFISLVAGATMENISEVEKLKKENKALRKRVEQLEKRIA